MAIVITAPLHGDWLRFSGLAHIWALEATRASTGALEDTLAERLRRRPAKPMGSPRVGSNPTGVVFLVSATTPFCPDGLGLFA